MDLFEGELFLHAKIHQQPTQFTDFISKLIISAALFAFLSDTMYLFRPIFDSHLNNERDLWEDSLAPHQREGVIFGELEDTCPWLIALQLASRELQTVSLFFVSTGEREIEREGGAFLSSSYDTLKKKKKKKWNFTRRVSLTAPDMGPH